MKKDIKFPGDFKKIKHKFIPNAVQWVYPKKGSVVISIVGGGGGLWGNGINTFEMYDFRENDVQGHLSKDEINSHLQNNPI